MSYHYFNLRGVKRGDAAGVNINSEAVACYYSNPMAEEAVIVELTSGAKFDVKAFLSEIEKWLEVR